MADNIETDPASGGATWAVASLTFSGDTCGVQVVGCGILSGSEGSWTISQLVGGAGAVAAGVQRVTLASDDPGVAHLATIAGDTTSLDGKVTACNTGAVVISSGTITTITNSVAVTGTFWQGTQPISAAALPLPSGAATQTTLATIAGYLDTEVAALVTAVQLLDNCISGNEAQVDVISSALPSGAATEATLATIDADTGAIKTAAQLLDDTVAVLGTATYTETTTKGNVVGAVRNDDLAPLADTDNELAPLQVNAEGALYVTQAKAEVKQASGVAVGGAPGADNMITAVAGKKILVLALSLFATSATTNTVYVDNVDNDLLGNSGNGIALSLDADGDTVAGFILPYNPGGWFKTDTVNEAVTLNTSAAQDIIWCITFIETD